MVVASNIHVRIGGKPVLHGINFAARPRELTAIVGPNGSGKSTLLKAITGDIGFTGTVHLGGVDVATLRPWELAARRAVLPQASTLAFPFTVLEVVKIGLRDTVNTAPDKRALDALGRLDLEHFAYRYYQELSGGEQQRVQLARVLSQVWEPVQDGVPRWLLLDEPVSALDIAHQLEVMHLAKDYAARGGGVVAVMHDLNLTAMFADAVTVLKEGSVLASGAPVTVLSDDTLSDAYSCPIRVSACPPSDTPFVLPHVAGQAIAEHILRRSNQR